MPRWGPSRTMLSKGRYPAAASCFPGRQDAARGRTCSGFWGIAAKQPPGTIDWILFSLHRRAPGVRAQRKSMPREAQKAALYQKPPGPQRKERTDQAECAVLIGYGGGGHAADRGRVRRLSPAPTAFKSGGPRRTAAASRWCRAATGRTADLQPAQVASVDLTWGVFASGPKRTPGNLRGAPDSEPRKPFRSVRRWEVCDPAGSKSALPEKAGEDVSSKPTDDPALAEGPG